MRSAWLTLTVLLLAAPAGAQDGAPAGPGDATPEAPDAPEGPPKPKRTNTVPIPGNADHDRAEKLFDEGREDMKVPSDTARLAAGCNKLAEAYRLLPRGDTLLNLAECHRRQNKTATAHREFGEALEYALAAEFDEAIEAATKLRIELGNNLSTFRIVVPEAVAKLPELALTLNGEPVALDTWAKATVTDPGTFEVTATAKDHKPFEATVELTADKDAKVVTVALEPIPEPPAPAPPPPPPAPEPAPVVDEGTPWWVWAIGGVGVAAIGGSIGAGVVAMQAGNELDDECGADRNACPPGYDSDAVYDRNVLTYGLFIGLGVGGLAAVGTAAGFLIGESLSDGDSNTAWTVTPTVAPSIVGVTVGRSF